MTKEEISSFLDTLGELEETMHEMIHVLEDEFLAQSNHDPKLHEKSSELINEFGLADGIKRSFELLEQQNKRSHIKLVD